VEELTFRVGLHSRRRQRRIVGRCILKNNVLDKECGGEPRSTQKQGRLSAHWILSCMACTEEWDLPVSGAQGGSPNIEDEW